MPCNPQWSQKFDWHGWRVITHFKGDRHVDSVRGLHIFCSQEHHEWTALESCRPCEETRSLGILFASSGDCGIDGHGGGHKRLRLLRKRL